MVLFGQTMLEQVAEVGCEVLVGRVRRARLLPSHGLPTNNLIPNLGHLLSSFICRRERSFP